MAVINPGSYTLSGKFVSFRHPHPSTFVIEDIAAGLSKVNRFAGQTDRDYSVADHCCNMVRHLYSVGENRRGILLGILLHDASEAYTSDITSPFKDMFPAVRDVEVKIYNVIARKFGAPLMLGEFRSIKEVLDKGIVHDESKELQPIAPEWYDPTQRLHARIVVSPSSHAAYDQYIQYFNWITTTKALTDGTKTTQQAV